MSKKNAPSDHHRNDLDLFPVKTSTSTETLEPPQQENPEQVPPKKPKKIKTKTREQPDQFDLTDQVTPSPAQDNFHIDGEIDDWPGQLVCWRDPYDPDTLVFGFQSNVHPNLAVVIFFLPAGYSRYLDDDDSLQNLEPGKIFPLQISIKHQE